MSSATSSPTSPQQRDGKGRFAHGNAGGPGNPFARQVAALRSAVLRVLTPERLEAVVLAVLTRAEAGDLAAAKLLLQYGVGKPVEAVDPDRMDADEWEKIKEAEPMIAEMPKLAKVPEPQLPLATVRAARPAVTRALAKTLGAVLRDPEKFLPEPVELEMAEDETPSPDGGHGDGGPSPSPDGSEPGWEEILAGRVGCNGHRLADA